MEHKGAMANVGEKYTKEYRATRNTTKKKNNNTKKKTAK